MVIFLQNAHDENTRSDVSNDLGCALNPNVAVSPVIVALGGKFIKQHV